MFFRLLKYKTIPILFCGQRGTDLVLTEKYDMKQVINEMIINGYDSGKWICVMPEQSLTSVSGSYVLLAVGSKAQTDAIAEVVRFFEDVDVKGKIVI